MQHYLFNNVFYIIIFITLGIKLGLQTAATAECRNQCDWLRRSEASLVE